MTKASVNRELAIIKRMFKLAVEWGFLESNPATIVKLFKEDERPIRVLSGEEKERLLEAASPHLRPIIVVALNTGMRRGEILGLNWENVSFGNRVITVEQSKSGRIRHISMNQDVLDALQGIEGPRSGSVFKWKGDAIQSVTRSFRTAPSLCWHQTLSISRSSAHLRYKPGPRRY